MSQVPIIGIIDYGLSNLPNVEKAVRFVGGEPVVIETGAEMGNVDKLILPGVGAFGAGMAGLAERGLVEPIQRAVKEGMPLLGICLGMQLLFSASEETKGVAGLGLLDGTVRQFSDTKLPVPHMGWNQLEFGVGQRLMKDCANGAYVYFVHSYYCAPENGEDIIARTKYGDRFAAIVGRSNIYGMQFHPEKSQAVGLRLLSNFINLKGV